MSKKLKTWAELNTECEELRATIERLKTELADAQETTKATVKSMGVNYEELQRLKKSAQAKNLLGQHPAEGKQ